MGKIAAVVVTFNRLELLKECLDGLLKQTLKLDTIIVVNNGSTDGTTDYLNKQDGFQVVHQENLGGAGGFARGMKEAYEQGYDWIWVMDDDVEPFEDGIEQLIRFKDISKCIHGLRVDINNKIHSLERFFDHRSCFCYGLDWSNFEAKNFFSINVSCFEGMLIHRSIISKIGLPDVRFFINGDDTLYGFMASKFTNVICVSKVVLKKKIVKENKKTLWGGSIDSSPLTSYYLYRNKFLIKRILSENFHIKSYSFNREMCYYISKDLIKTALSLNFKYTNNIILGVIHGMSNRFGRK